MSYENYIKAVHEIDARLQYHSTSGSGRLLDGLLYDRAAKIQPLGVNQLPFLQPFEWADEETAGVAGGSVDAQHASNAHVAYQHAMTLTFLLATRREWGWFAEDYSSLDANPRVNNGGLGNMQLAARVKDAMEIKRDGSGDYDGSLNGLLYRPMAINVRENFMTDMSTMVVIEVVLVLEAECRGNRSSLSGLPVLGGVDAEGGYALFSTGDSVVMPALGTPTTVDRIIYDVYITADAAPDATLSGLLQTTTTSGIPNSLLLGAISASVGSEVVSLAGSSAGAHQSYGGVTIEAGFHSFDWRWNATTGIYDFYLDGIRQSQVTGSTAMDQMDLEKLRIGQTVAGVEPAFGFVRLRVWDDDGPVHDIAPTAGADITLAATWVDSIQEGVAETVTGATWADA